MTGPKPKPNKQRIPACIETNLKEAPGSKADPDADASEKLNYAQPMESFEVSTDGELFRISERQQPSGAASYDFAWLNGPANGTYGFTIGSATSDPHTDQPDHSPKMSTEELATQVQNFVDSFYGVRGTGSKDFPGHQPARLR